MGRDRSSSAYPLPGFEFRVSAAAPAGWDARLPVDLDAVAAGLGLRVRRAQLPITIEGQTCWAADSTTITVASDVSADRARFTLAHELAHVLLVRPEIAAVVRRHGGLRPDQVERMCDRVAVELLLPGRLVRGIAEASDEFSLADMQRLARANNVSLVVLLNRLASLGGRRIMVTASWGRSGAWCVTGTAGPIVARRLRVELPDEIHGVSGTVRARMFFGELSQSVDCEYRRQHSWVSILLPGGWTQRMRKYWRRAASTDRTALRIAAADS